MNKTNQGEVLVRVEGVSKKFCKSLKKSLWYGVCDIASELSPFGRGDIAGDGRSEMGDGGGRKAEGEKRRAKTGGLRDGEFWAVNDVSFELRRGECLGLIGHNGAGKTTLLKMLNGLIKPDRGRIEMRGRVGALIALGAGFNPILTGRENIYINGSVLGLSKKEIDEKIEDIIDFAEIGEFINMPVQNYSSGMSVRLGFSIASSLKPDVLLLDEVLAVGDISFVVKCLNRVRELTSNCAVILVSHNMQSISSFCTKALLMEHGVIKSRSNEPSQAIDRYYKMAKTIIKECGSKEIKLLMAKLQNKKRILQGEVCKIKIRFSVPPSCPASILYIYIADSTMNPLYCFPVVDRNKKIQKFGTGTHEVEIPLGKVELTSGSYNFIFSFHASKTKKVLLRSQGLCPFRVYAHSPSWGKMLRYVTPIKRPSNLKRKKT